MVPTRVATTKRGWMILVNGYLLREADTMPDATGRHGAATQHLGDISSDDDHDVPGQCSAPNAV
jgi:hypothetical protein